MKRLVVLAAVVTLVSLFVSCGGGGSKSGGGGTAVTRDPNAKVDIFDKSLPKMKVRVSTLTGYTIPDSRTEKWLEERYNIDMEIVPLPGASEAPAKTSLLMADDKERPDVVWWSGMEADFAKWKDAGLLVDLTDYMNKYTVMRDYYDGQDPRIMFYASSAGGRIFRIPGDVAEPGCETLWIRKDWLDKLGLPVPKTMAEYNAALYAFANKDPDGNGKKDTYGLAGQGNDLRSFWPWQQGAGTGRGNVYFQFVKMPDGSYEFSGATEDTKKWIGQVAQLMKDGVINPNIVVPTTSRGEEMARGGFGSMHAWVAWNNPNTTFDSFYATNPNAKWIPLRMPVGDTPGNDGYGVENAGYLSAWCFFGITKSASDPERLYAIWDDMGSPEPYVIKRWGLEGQEYRTNPDGSHTLIIRPGSNEALEKQIGIDLFHDLFARKDEYNFSNMPETVQLFADRSKDSRPAYDIGIEKKDPNMYKVWNEYGAELLDIRNAYIYNVIGGTESINDWNAYIARLKANGLDEVLAELKELYPKQQEEERAYLASRGF
jgi:putative aldouronate transport system substrate-binding protein